MAKKTVRKNKAVVELEPEEFLEYKLVVSGARANFGWADARMTILTHEDFDIADTVVWQLKSRATPDGKIELTVPQNQTYRRVEKLGEAPRFQLELAFVTAVKYTLTVRRLDAAGVETDFPTDLDYQMETQGESVGEGLFVGLGRTP